MKHKSWIKNYERDFARLAEEIGDLRYDTLAELLGLVADKIKRDGLKDKQRGRKQLARRLLSASEELLESSKNIQKAWDICEPYMFPLDISNKIKKEFKNKIDQKTAFQLLSKYDKNWDTDAHFRLARCVLFETKGSLDILKNNIQLANQDPRDMMVQAEYDLDMNRVRNFNRPFGEAEIRAEDLETGESIGAEGGNLPF